MTYVRFANLGKEPIRSDDIAQANIFRPEIDYPADGRGRPLDVALASSTREVIQLEVANLAHSERAARLVPDCDAKLIFTLQGHDGPQVERMWVRITGYSDAGHVGVLNNNPRITGAPIAGGERVESRAGPRDRCVATGELESRDRRVRGLATAVYRGT